MRRARRRRALSCRLRGLPLAGELREREVRESCGRVAGELRELTVAEHETACNARVLEEEIRGGEGKRLSCWAADARLPAILLPSVLHSSTCDCLCIRTMYIFVRSTCTQARNTLLLACALTVQASHLCAHSHFVCVRARACVSSHPLREHIL